MGSISPSPRGYSIPKEDDYMSASPELNLDGLSMNSSDKKPYLGPILSEDSETSSDEKREKQRRRDIMGPSDI